jgi:L-fuconolactonase
LVFQRFKEQIIQLSKENNLIRGIVGWTDLMSKDISKNLNRLKSISNDKLIGIRHLLQYEDFNWIWQDEVQRGLQCLQDNNISFDLSLKPPDLKHVPELAVKFPKLSFIIDHMAKPKAIIDYTNDVWFVDIKKASEFSNIYCKLSGLVSEVTQNWSIELFEPYVKVNIFRF